MSDGDAGRLIEQVQIVRIQHHVRRVVWKGLDIGREARRNRGAVLAQADQHRLAEMLAAAAPADLFFVRLSSIARSALLRHYGWTQAAIEQARGAKDLFIEYRVELEAAQKQIAQYLDQLIRVNRSLGEAQGRIARLETELMSAHAEARDIRDQLNEALRERERQSAEREKLIEEIAELQKRIQELETRNRQRINKIRNSK